MVPFLRSGHIRNQNCHSIVMFSYFLLDNLTTSIIKIWLGICLCMYLWLSYWLCLVVNTEHNSYTSTCSGTEWKHGKG